MTPHSSHPWRDVTAARLPAEHVTALAPVRDRAGIRVLPAGAAVWVRWPAGQADVVRCLLSVPGVTFFTFRLESWYPFGQLVPTDDRPPEGAGVPIAAALVPGRFEPLATAPVAWPPLVLTVARGGVPRPVTALTCDLGTLAWWADTATAAEIAAVRAARSGARAVLLGDRLPALPGATRYWGMEVLVPVGFRPDPELPGAALRDACGVAMDELLLLDETGAEAIPRAAFEPLTRAGIRLGAKLP